MKFRAVTCTISYTTVVLLLPLSAWPFGAETPPGVHYNTRENIVLGAKQIATSCVSSTPFALMLMWKDGTAVLGRHSWVFTPS